MLDSLACHVSAFDNFGRLIIERRMETLAIVKSFKISEDDVFCFSARAEGMVMDALGFECATEAVRGRIIKTVVGTAQADLNSKLLKDGLIVGTGVLSTSIGMIQ